MTLMRQSLLLFITSLSFYFCSAQIEVAHISVKEFKETGFGSFLNFALPVSDANYLTLEGGLQYFENSDNESVGIFPVLIGYRYTINHSGTGFYVEPNAGYSFGETTIGVYDEVGSPMTDDNGKYLYEKVNGLTAGIGLGYLFEPSGGIQFNIGLRYERSFGNTATNLFAFRIAHAFTFGRRQKD